MKMNWFKKQYGVCKECGVHFEPRNDSYPDLCLEHMKPVEERDRKRERVVQWARENWEKLYEQYEKDESAKRAAFNAMASAGMGAMQAQAQMAAQTQQCGNLSALAGLGNNLFPW